MSLSIEKRLFRETTALLLIGGLALEGCSNNSSRTSIQTSGKVACKTVKFEALKGSPAEVEIGVYPELANGKFVVTRWQYIGNKPITGTPVSGAIMEFPSHNISKISNMSTISIPTSQSETVVFASVNENGQNISCPPTIMYFNNKTYTAIPQLPPKDRI